MKTRSYVRRGVLTAVAPLLFVVFAAGQSGQMGRECDRGIGAARSGL